MAGSKETGRRSANLRIQRSYWQQAIKRQEYVAMIVKSTLVTVVTAWLYYRSVFAVVVLLPVWVWYYKSLEKDCIRKKKQEFELQFKEMIQTISSALNTGYSMENAIRESQKELQVLYEEEALISRELLVIVRELRMQIPVEQVMEKLADRVGVEDVKNFAAVFVTAKRSGGDMIGIIRNTVGQIGDKIDVRREIETILAAKKYEFKVMSVIPYLIIAYMSFSFPEFMDCLYGNPVGIGVMTVCLVIYMSAYYLGARLIEIEV